MSRHVRAAGVWVASAGLVALSACNDLADPIGSNPADNTDTTEVVQFTDAVTVSKATDAVDARSARVGIVITGDDLVAAEVNIEWPNLRMDDEIVRSRITSLADDAQTMTLVLGDLVLDLSRVEEFLESNENPLTRGEFVAAVRAALEMGEIPGVQAQRAPAAQPQAPEDGTFAPTSLRLDDVEAHVVELNIDRDNFTRNEAPPPDGWLTVLGVPIELRVTEGITRIHVERPDLDVRRFDGAVAGVDLENRTFTLEDGTVVAITDRARIKPYFWAGHHRLRNLEAVQQALAAGFAVHARGRGVVVSDNPLTLVAIHVRFRLDRVHFTKFEGEVAAVDVEASTVTLTDETAIKIIDHSIVVVLDGDVKTRSLDAVAKAVDEGRKVTVHGFGFVADEGDDAIFAVFAWFRIAPRDLQEFSGRVTSVDLETSSFVVDNELTVRVTDETRILMHHDDHQGLESLEAVQRALEAGFGVAVEGAGVPHDGDDPVITALKVRFEIELDDPVEFEGIVRSVDVEAREFLLTDGTVIRLTDATVVHPKIGYAHGILTLELIARALEAGLTVTARGKGVLVGEDPPTIVAATVHFNVDFTAVIEFAGVVTDVDLENRTFVLEDETIVHVVEGSDIAFGEGLESLEDVAAAVTAGDVSVTARGKGAVRAREPLTLIALSVHFAVD